MRIRDILNEQIRRIKPSASEIERLNSYANRVLKKLGEAGLKGEVGGSLGKGTIMRRKKQDIDIFVVFENEEELKKFYPKIKKNNFGSIQKIHGSRDYFRTKIDEVIIELIPVLKGGTKNSVDVSLAHVKYVRDKLKNNEKIRDEILLAKQFSIAQRVYGAESYIRGFSGYALEVLIIYYNGFLSFLKKFGEKKVIDPEKRFRNAQSALREINKAKLESPVILVDPTYKYRNVLAGLREESYRKFLKARDKFLKNPSEEFFIVKDIDINGLKTFAKNSNAKFIEVYLETDRQEGDVAGAKMKKFFDFFVAELGRKEQKVLEKEFDYSGEGKKAKGYLVVKEKKEIQIKGPKDERTESVKKFREVHKNSYKKNNIWMAKEEISIEKIFDQVSKKSMEMGARGKIKIYNP